MEHHSVTYSRGFIGRHRDIYHSRNRDATCGKMEKDCRYGHRESPRCARHGCVILTTTACGPLTTTHLVGGYEFLMEQCALFEKFAIGRKWRCSSRLLDHAEDKICIFGFSRGAYIARALAGMIHKVCFYLRHICRSDHDLFGCR